MTLVVLALGMPWMSAVFTTLLDLVVAYPVYCHLHVLVLGSGLLVLGSGLLVPGSDLLVLGSDLLILGSGLLVLGSGLLILGSGLLVQNALPGFPLQLFSSLCPYPLLVAALSLR